MTPRTIRVTLNGTGFAAGYTAACYGLIPHKNGVAIELAGVTSGRLERAQAFAEARGISQAFASHAAMLAAVRPDIDNICCANHAHGPYVREAADAGVQVIVLEKPPVVWPGLAEGACRHRLSAHARKRWPAFARCPRRRSPQRQQAPLRGRLRLFRRHQGVGGVAARNPQGQGKVKILLSTRHLQPQGSHARVTTTPRPCRAAGLCSTRRVIRWGHVFT